MESESDVITYQHFRIPDVLKSPRKGSSPEKLLFLWNPKWGFEKGKGWPFIYFMGPKTYGGRTVCTITTENGFRFVGSVGRNPYLRMLSASRNGLATFACSNSRNHLNGISCDP